jgi:hypothetical protein
MHLPFEFDYVKSCFIVSVIIMVIIGNVFAPSEIVTSLIIFTLLGLPMSYFIKNNIPVSSFFNAKAWDYYEVLFTPNDKKVSHAPTTSDYSKNAPYYSPSYSSQLSNIYHRYHK